MKWREGLSVNDYSALWAGIFKASGSTDPMRIRKRRKELVPALLIYRLDQLTSLSLGICCVPAEPASVSPGKIIVAP